VKVPVYRTVSRKMYRGADKSLARPTSRRILFDGENISFDTSLVIYWVIHNFLRDFRPLRYSSGDGHAEVENVKRGRDTPSFCTTLKVLDISTLASSQLTQFWQIPRHRTLSYNCPRHVSSRLPPSGATCKYAMALSAQNKPGEILYLFICSFLLCLSWLLCSRFRNFRRDLRI